MTVSTAASPVNKAVISGALARLIIVSCVFTERSSKQISHRHKVVCGRDEDTDLYQKIYRYERDGEPARDIAMQCMEYQLSTRGGRKGCE